MFLVKQLSGVLNSDNSETEALKFWNPAAAPDLFNQQHREVLAHFIANETGYFD